MKKQKSKFYVERTHWATQTSIIFMALALVFRLIGCWGLWNDSFYAATQIALPLISGVLFILFVLLFGRVALWTTALPVLLGVVFFIFKSLGFESVLHTVLCILLYLLVAVLYTGTVFGLIPTKWLLLPLFGLPFAYHIAVEDLPALQNAAETVTAAGALQEISVLSIMLSLFFLAVAMKKKPRPEPELPKIKDPKVIPPERLRKIEGEQPEQKENPESNQENVGTQI